MNIGEAAVALLGVLARIFSREWPASPSKPEGWTIGDPSKRHPYEINPDHPFAELASGMQFHATFQTRTPLRILRRHGQVVPLGTKLADDFEPWMGMWVIKAKTWREIGIEMDEVDEDFAVPGCGEMRRSELLDILIEIMEAAEDPAGGTSARVQRVRAICSRPELAAFAASQGGVEAVGDHLFPPVLSLIPGLPRSSQAALRQLGLATVAALRAASDETLLAVNGIGPAKLEVVREFCAGYDGDRDGDRAVNLAA